MPDRIRSDHRRAHRELTGWLNKHRWTPEEAHKALVASGYTGERDQFVRFAGSLKPVAVRGAGSIITFVHHNAEPGPFADWMAVQGSAPRSHDEIMARKIDAERRRHQHQREWLARELRGCRPAPKPRDEFEGLDAGAVAALSGGTIRMGVVRYG
jgi:hypothetical protein